jgi:hypothetical protein
MCSTSSAHSSDILVTARSFSRVPLAGWCEWVVRVYFGVVCAIVSGRVFVGEVCVCMCVYVCVYVGVGVGVGGGCYCMGVAVGVYVHYDVCMCVCVCVCMCVHDRDDLTTRRSDRKRLRGVNRHAIMRAGKVHSTTAHQSVPTRTYQMNREAFNRCRKKSMPTSKSEGSSTTEWKTKETDAGARSSLETLHPSIQRTRRKARLRTRCPSSQRYGVGQLCDVHVWACWRVGVGVDVG